ncbi:MAG: hypothetical protein AB8G05_11650 [Oligoflexales bacterium]
MNDQKFLFKLIVLMGIYSCTTPSRITKPTEALNNNPNLKTYESQFNSDPTLHANYSPLRISNKTCRENQAYILKQVPAKQIEFGIYQSFSLNKLSFNKSGFFTGYRCTPQQ